ncbi:MAG: hypothetical protein Q4E58_11095 [Prevotellaceae bacterium]|nr:hypothetical protein [Prevotellaceae bacterium]
MLEFFNVFVRIIYADILILARHHVAIAEYQPWLEPSEGFLVSSSPKFAVSYVWWRV